MIVDILFRARSAKDGAAEANQTFDRTLNQGCALQLSYSGQFSKKTQLFLGSVTQQYAINHTFLMYITGLLTIKKLMLVAYFWQPHYIALERP